MSIPRDKKVAVIFSHIGTKVPIFELLIFYFTIIFITDLSFYHIKKTIANSK